MDFRVHTIKGRNFRKGLPPQVRGESVKVPRLELYPARIEIVPSTLLGRPAFRARGAVEQAHPDDGVQVASGGRVVTGEAVQQHGGERRVDGAAAAGPRTRQVAGDERGALGGRQQKIVRAQVGEDGVVRRGVVGRAGALFNGARECGAGGVGTA